MGIFRPPGFSWHHLSPITPIAWIADFRGRHHSLDCGNDTSVHALLGWFLLKEELGWTKTLGILLAFIGVLLVVSKGNIASISVGRFGAPGDSLILISAVNWAVFSALSRRGLKSHPASL